MGLPYIVFFFSYAAHSPVSNRAAALPSKFLVCDFGQRISSRRFHANQLDAAKTPRLHKRILRNNADMVRAEKEGTISES